MQRRQLRFTIDFLSVPVNMSTLIPKKKRKISKFINKQSAPKTVDNEYK